MADIREKMKQQFEEMKKSLFGLDQEIKIFILSKAADLTVLMLGEHAIAKSLNMNTPIVVYRGEQAMAITIKEVKKGDRVIGLDNSLDFLLTEVKDVLSFQENRELMRVETRTGRKVEATQDHSFLIWDIESGKFLSKKGSELREGDIIPTFRARSLPTLKEKIGGFKADFDLGFIFGAYLAEGCIYYHKKNQHYQIRFAQTQKKFKNFLHEALLRHSIKNNIQPFYVGASRKDLYMLLEQLFKKGSGNKEVPLDFLFTPYEFKKGLLSGYFSGDGCLDSKSICWTSKSKKLRDGIGLLLSSIGIGNSFFEDASNKRYGIYYRGYVFDKEEFLKQVEIIRDNIKLPSTFQQGRYELCIPPKELIRKIASELRLHSGKKKGYFNAYWGRAYRKKILGRKGLSTFLEFLKRNGLNKEDETSIKDLINSTVVFDPIERITKIPYAGQVFDLETSTGNFMTAEGLIVHNSSLARVWSITMGMDFRIVTSSEVDESLIAYIDPAIFRAQNVVVMRRGELMTKDHILVDEFFLWGNKFRAKLHQLLEEHTYAGLDVLTKTYTFATNPLTEHYSGQIEDRNLATEDRIDLLLPMYQPKVVPTQMMIKKFGVQGRKEIELSKVIDWQDYINARQEIMKIEIPSDILVWLTLFAESMSACRYSDSKFDISRARMHTLCAECNQKEHLCAKVALSKPRFLRATILLAKALAWFDEREEISEEDVFTAIKYTLPHRLIFLKEERTIFEAERALPDLVQQFIDDFNNWESRRIFQRLEEIIIKAKDPKEPVFDNEASNTLINETSEHLAISNYVTEAVERIKEAVKKRYREILMQSSGNLEDMKATLIKSGLDLYEKGQILEDIIGQNPNLTFYHSLDRRDEASLEHLAKALRKIHREEGDLSIKPKARLLKQFKKEIAFASDLLIIKEERGRIKITASTPELKKKIESYLKQEVVDEKE